MLNVLLLAMTFSCILGVLSWRVIDSSTRQSVVSTPAVDKQLSSAIDLRQFLRFRRADSTTIIDVRSRKEYDAGHINGAVSMPWVEMVDKPDIQARAMENLRGLVVVYCGGRNCGSASRAAKELGKYALGRVFWYRDGWEEWVELGFTAEVKEGLR